MGMVDRTEFWEEDSVADIMALLSEMDAGKPQSSGNTDYKKWVRSICES